MEKHLHKISKLIVAHVKKKASVFAKSILEI